MKYRTLIKTLLTGLFAALLIAVMSSNLFAQDTTEPAAPQSVTIAGTIQSLLGCANDWAPECDQTFLTYDPVNDLWQATFDLPAGNYEYKAALNGTWDISYGAHADAEAGSANIVLELANDASVTFTFDAKTGWVTDNINSLMANVPGSFQSVVGCSGDWMPECLRTWLEDPDGDGIYVYQSAAIPAGDYEAKVAVNGSWTENYGAEGAKDGANIPFTVPDGGALVTFSFDDSSKLLTIMTGDLPKGVEAPTTPAVELATDLDIVVPKSPTEEPPSSVTIAGTIQSILGCANDWAPECDKTFLTYVSDYDIWRGTFNLPAGDYEYKAALNGNWTVSVGLHGDAVAGSANIPLSLAEDTAVTFLYDHKTGYVWDTVNQILATVPGSYQDEIGCASEWMPACLKSILEDMDGDGVYTYLAPGIPKGKYEAKVALDESWSLNYGAEGAKDGANISFEVPDDQLLTVFNFDTATNIMTIEITNIPEGMVVAEGPVQRGSLTTAKAYWVSEDTLLWNARDAAEDTVYKLHSNFTGRLELVPEGVKRGVDYLLTVDPNGPGDVVLEKFPDLKGLTTLKIAEDDLNRIPAMLRGQIALSATAPDGTLLDATTVQTFGVLDDLYANDSALGVTWTGDVPTISVWAPTAKKVGLQLFDDSNPDSVATAVEMIRDDATGVWSVTGEADWKGKYYLFEVQVYVRTTGKLETNLVTDPYSLSLSLNGTRSQIVDLADAGLKPEGWDSLIKPVLNAPEDITIYELHVRDFSIFDETVRPEYRGTFMAFTETQSGGMLHLISLQQAGLSHIHLLPAFDIATINENAADRVEPDREQLASFPPDSDQQQALMDATRDQDGFNWGYDPYHYTVPEGSYSTNPDGPTRIVEFRNMVQSLNQNGLRVVMDVVYNHTSSAGQTEKSVLDKIVPDYYYRLDPNGNITTSTCCSNTATEHNMMEKLMIDSLVVWAKDYKVDGFRFDLMGHHMKSNIEHARAALDALTLEKDGVDGKQIYLYGEGWNFGEVADNARGINATQFNMAGTGVGTFNDRLRDAVRGGSPFGGLQEQGFINGLYVNPNGITPGTEEEQLQRLLMFSDQIRVGLAGNLADYQFTGSAGDPVTGSEVLYNGKPAGYTQDPQEQIIYIEAHDNETLFDVLQTKAPEGTSMSDKVRMQGLGLSIVTLSQGVPFYHAGMDMLRSKSMDRNSYNSGDWFNALDFSGNDNGWGHGLPPAGDNKGNWTIYQTLLANPDFKPTAADVQNSVNHFEDMLRVRYSSPLFRLQTADQVQEMLSFQNTGPDQIPGLIVMTLSDTQNLDDQYRTIVVLFNANPETITFSDDAVVGMPFELHPVLAASSDTIVQESAFDSSTGSFSVPGLTTAVFVLKDSK